MSTVYPYVFVSESINKRCGFTRLDVESTQDYLWCRAVLGTSVHDRAVLVLRQLVASYGVENAGDRLASPVTTVDNWVTSYAVRCVSGFRIYLFPY